MKKKAILVEKDCLIIDMDSVKSLYCGDCRDVIRGFDNNFIDLVVTSPPYNVGIDYDEYNDEIPLPEYRCLLRDLFVVLDWKVKDSGRVCLNVPLKNDNGIIDVPSIVKKLAEDIGWEMRFEIVWDKGSSESSSAWGSWRSPSSPRPIFNHEYILVFDVGGEKKDYCKSLSKEDFMRYIKSVWSISPETKSEHPAPFPKEIPKRLIKMNTYEDDIVLDPFVGSGTTAVASEQLNRNWIGIDLSENYIKLSEKRIISETGKDVSDRSVFDY